MIRRGVLIALVIACAAVGQARDGGVGRVTVEAVWADESDVAGRRILSLITGSGDAALFVRPYAVAWLGERLIVTDPGRGSLVVLERGERPVHSPAGMLPSPVGVTACGGSPWVTDSERGEVVRFEPDLRSHEVIVSGLARPTGIACVDGRIFVLETAAHRVAELDGGRVVARFGTRGREDGAFNYPTLIAGQDGELVVGDAMNFRVQRLTTGGVPVESFGELGDAPGTMPRMKGLALDAEGNVWISDAYLDRIAVFDRHGRFLLDLGGSGELSFPAGIAIRPDGLVAVVDSLNARIQILRVERPGGAR